MSELLARRLLDGARIDEVKDLREENAVMRNLLRDMVENESSLANCQSMEERMRRHKNRTARRRELFGEAIVLLDHAAAPSIKIPQFGQ
jgi:hypothetical protein